MPSTQQHLSFLGDKHNLLVHLSFLGDKHNLLVHQCRC